MDGVNKTPKSSKSRSVSGDSTIRASAPVVPVSPIGDFEVVELDQEEESLLQGDTQSLEEVTSEADNQLSQDVNALKRAIEGIERFFFFTRYVKKKIKKDGIHERIVRIGKAKCMQQSCGNHEYSFSTISKHGLKKHYENVHKAMLGDLLAAIEGQSKRGRPFRLRSRDSKLPSKRRQLSLEESFTKKNKMSSDQAMNMSRNKMLCETDAPCEFPREGLVKPSFRHTSSSESVKLNEKVKAMIQSGRNVAHFSLGQSPFPIPEAFQVELARSVNQNEYLAMKGIPELRKAIAEFHQHFDEIKLDVSYLMVGPGSMELILMIMNLFDGVIFLTSPAWSSYESQAIISGNQPIILATDKSRGWKVTPECISAGLEHLNSPSRRGAKLLLISNPGNPSGVCYTERELRDLSDFCRLNKIVILSDEIYARLTFSRKHVSVAKFYPEGTIIASSFSKWASIGGWRLGYVYIPPTLDSLYNAMIDYASLSYCCAPVPIQFAAAYALIRHLPELEEYMDDCSAILKIVSEFCHRELCSVGVTGKLSEAGFYFMPNFEIIRNGLRKRGILTASQMTKAMLEEADVGFVASEEFLRPCSELSVSFCFVCFDGSQALKVYREKKNGGILLLQARKEEKERFLRENCKTVVDGIQRLKDWVLENKS